ncbi:MAG: AAA family ATPase [Desulfobacteraceae bacterium]|nr:AAA family ATPase [Desulfobacteraceae bacterium]
MKLLYLDMIAFGPFTHKRLDFSAGNHGLHIVYGANEAGKSSALRSLRYALYGIPERSSDDFIHPRDKLRIGISLSDGNGKHSEFIRRKGRINTLRSSDDVSVIAESELRAFLSGADELMFATMFGIDHAALIRGGEEIVRGGGNIGQILFAAGSGISDFRKVQVSLQADAEKLFKPSGKNPRINEARSEITEYQKQLREIRLSASDWALHDETLRNAITRKTATDADIAEKMRQKSRLERIKNALPVISRRKESLTDLEPYRHAVLLSQDFGERRRKIITDLKIAESSVLSAEKILKRFGHL